MVFPPQGEPTYPHPALPLLKAVIERDTESSAQVIDLNLAMYRWILSPAVMSALGVFLEHHAGEAREHAGQDIRALGGALLLRRAHWTAAWLARTVDRFLAVLDGRRWSPEAYERALRVLPRAFECFNIANHGHDLSLKSHTWPGGHRSSHSIRTQAVAAGNPLRQFYSWMLPEVEGDLIGISLAWPSQLVPTFTLARVIKETAPEAKIVLGGSLVPHLLAPMLASGELLSDIDFVVPHEGEQPLRDLVLDLEGGGTGAQVPGVYAREKNGGWRQLGGPGLPADLATLPTPDFSDLQLAEYLSPELVLPVAASRGCYWGRCTFCEHDFHTAGFRRRPTEWLVADIKALLERHECTHYFFVDDALPPRTLGELTAASDEHGLDIQYAAELRFEPGLTQEVLRDAARTGCHTLLFGLESGSQQTLDAMAKGTDLEVARQVLADAHAAGIITWCFAMVGSPGESRSAIDETFAFLRDHSEQIDVISGGRFIMARNAPLRLRTEELDPQLSVAAEEQDLQLTYGWSHPGSPASEVLDEVMVDGTRRFELEERYRKLPWFVEPHTLALDQAFFEPQPSAPQGDFPVDSPLALAREVFLDRLPMPSEEGHEQAEDQQVVFVPETGELVMLDPLEGRLVEAWMQRPGTVQQIVHRIATMPGAQLQQVEVGDEVLRAAESLWKRGLLVAGG